MMPVIDKVNTQALQPLGLQAGAVGALALVVADVEQVVVAVDAQVLPVAVPQRCLVREFVTPVQTARCHRAAARHDIQQVLPVQPYDFTG